MSNHKPHTEATKALMRHVHKVIGQRPEVKLARSKAAKTLWETKGRDAVVAAQKEGWVKRRIRIKRERDEKNAAAVAAHLERIKQ